VFFLHLLLVFFEKVLPNNELLLYECVIVVMAQI